MRPETTPAPSCPSPSRWPSGHCINSAWPWREAGSVCPENTGRGGGGVLLTAAAVEMTAPLLPRQMWCDAGRSLANASYILPFSVLSFHSRLFLSLFELLSILLLPPELPLCSWQRRLVLPMGREGYLLPSAPMLALWVPRHGGLLEACDKHLPTVGGSHLTALHPLCHRASRGPHVTSSRSAYSRVGRAGGKKKKKNSPLDHDLGCQRGQKILFLCRHPDFFRFQ